VVDCVSRRLVKISQDVPYICLSYVWGSFQAEEPTSDGKLPLRIPKTIEDALFVAICLEIPYLWVDCYCINQNNIHEKHNTIRAMDKIYSGAELTIIAVVGIDPHHGLPGVRETPRRPQYKITMVGETYVTAEDVRAEIASSAWSSRGWTYQEMLLSRRRLVFTTSQMYYHCWESIHLESISFNVTATYLETLYRVFPQRGVVGDRLEDLQRRLSEYYKRQLSYHSDTVAAFQGIINAFHVSKSPSVFVTQFYGILVLGEYNRDELDMARTSFLAGLGWEVRPASFSSSDVFPSWTWASTTIGGSANSSRHLYPGTIVPRSAHRKYHDIEVTLTCRHESSQVQSYSITKYPSYDGDYKDFWPWFDITTWTQQCEVKMVSSTTGTVDIYDATMTIYDPLALQLGQVHAVCTETTGHIRFGNPMIQVEGLLVVEAVPGEYRRVGIFHSHV
ncbi:heterokaryon incompatibility protein-domain-containing protein, partial [Paraphoma chrysanthemicola]